MARAGRGDGEAVGEADAGFARWAKHIATGLRELQRSGELDASADCDALAQATLAAYQGGVLLAQVHGDLGPLRAALAGARAAIHAARI